MLLGVNHLQVNVSLAQLLAAREFYVGFLGLTEVPRPAVFKSEGFWLNAGQFEVHIGVEDGVDRHATRAHVAYEVSDLPGWRAKIEAMHFPIVEQPKIPGYDRFHFRDPFGNNIELIARI